MAAQCSSLRPASAPACTPAVCEQDRNRFHAIWPGSPSRRRLPSIVLQRFLVFRNLSWRVGAFGAKEPNPQTGTPPVSAPAPRWDIFCTVVDNYGDVGVAWRLARQLAGEHAIAVRLFVDDMRALARLAPEIDAATSEQRARGVDVRRWGDTQVDLAADPG